MQSDLRLKKISDILDNAEYYIAEMRADENIITIPSHLNQYMWEYFREVDMSKEVLEGLALFAVDKTYQIASALTTADKYTFAFFSEVMSKLWDKIQDRGVDTFYILDNTIREDRFKLVYNIYRLSGFCVVTPYFDTTDTDALKTKEEKTVHFVMDAPLFYDYCSVEAVEAQIRKYMKPIQNIAYIEIDSRVNYLDRVKEIAKDSNYLCVLRNIEPSDKRVEIIRSNFIHKKT